MRIFLDFEASSLSDDSYPIEIGWAANASGATLARSTTGRRLAGAGAPAADGIETAGDERLTLRVAPALDALLPAESVLDAVEGRAPGELDRKASTGVGAALAGAVLVETAGEIARATDVEGAVGAPKDVHV